MEERYGRHISLEEVGANGQAKIKASKVLMIGAGGLGCPVLQYLVAAGVGCIGIVDGDKVSLSNLQRQVLYSEEDVGFLKVDCAKQRLQKLNSEIEIYTYPFFLENKKALELIKEFDIVIDGTDQVHIRYLLDDACRILNKPLVFAGIHKFEGQVSVFHDAHGFGYRDLFPNPPKQNELPSCSEVGVLGVLPGIVGTVQANEVLKLILNIGSPLSGKLWLFDAKSMKSQIIKFLKQEESSAPRNEEEFLELNYNGLCEVNTQDEISMEEALSKHSLGKGVFLDIREPFEMPKLEIEYKTFDNSILEDLLESDKEVLVICQHGIRSLRFTEQMKNEGYTNVVSVKGGVAEYFGID